MVSCFKTRALLQQCPPAQQNLSSSVCIHCNAKQISNAAAPTFNYNVSSTQRSMGLLAEGDGTCGDMGPAHLKALRVSNKTNTNYLIFMCIDNGGSHSCKKNALLFQNKGLRMLCKMKKTLLYSCGYCLEMGHTQKKILHTYFFITYFNFQGRRISKDLAQIKYHVKWRIYFNDKVKV